MKRLIINSFLLVILVAYLTFWYDWSCVFDCADGRKSSILAVIIIFMAILVISAILDARKK